MKKLEVGVIGLGKFGMQLGATLTELGHRVVGLDEGEGRVRMAQEMLSRVYRGDATDRTVLEQLRFQDMDCVVVSVGHSMETSILVALNLHDLKVKNTIVKAISPEHRKVLLRLGVHRVVQPEVDVAVQTAHRLANPGMLDFLPLGGGVLLQEVVVEAWAGKALAELDLTNRHGVMVVAKKSATDKDFSFVPDPRASLAQGDSLVLIGKPEAILALEP